jgi:serine/threonine-protein kinase
VGAESGGSPEIPEEVVQAARRPAAHFGKYVLLQEIGRGGMGRVYRAWDTHLGRRVALKMLLFHEPEDLMRFRQEAQLAAKLDHPGIVQVYELGDVDERPYIAMQYVDGASLEGPRLPVRKAVEAIRDAARAIAFAHEKGVIHRDLKPGNLLLSREGRVRVTDFGLAKRVGAFSVSGMALGTPSYMSPEQARGEASRVGLRSDVYSLGASLYGLLASRPPFVGEDVMSVLRGVATEDPPPLARFNTKVPRDLETVILKAMEKDPERRYDGAAELADDLDRFLQGEAVLAQRPGFMTRARKAAARRKALLAVAAAGALATTGTAWFVVPRWQAERGARERAQAEAQRLRDLGALWTKVVVAKQGFHQAASDPARVRARLKESVAEVGAFVARNPRLPQGYYVRAWARLYLDDLDGAERDLREAIAIEPAFAPGLALLGRVRLEQHQWKVYGDEARQAERFRKAAPLVAEAADLLSRGTAEGTGSGTWGLVSTREDEVAAVVAQALAERFGRGRAAEAVRILEEAQQKEGAAEYCNWLGLLHSGRDAQLHWQSRALELMPHWAKPWLDRGVLRLRVGDGEAAISDFDRAVALAPRRAVAYANRGAAHVLRGNADLAVSDLDRALELDPGNVSALVNRAAARAAKGDTEGALGDLERALALDPDTATAWYNRALLRKGRGDAEGAIADLGRAIALNASDAAAHQERGLLRAAAGDLVGAEEDFVRVIALRPGDAEAYGNRGSARLARGDLEGASADVEQALGRSPGLATAHHTRGLLRARRGDAAGALEAFTRAVELRPDLSQAWLARAQLKAQSGDLVGALADLDRAIALPSPPALAYLGRGGVREALGRAEPGRAKEYFTAALRDLEKALELGVRDAAQRGQAEALVARLREALRGD